MKEKFVLNMDNSKEKPALENYKITLDFLKWEATTLWQIFNAFFIGNNLFVVIIFGFVKDNKDQPSVLMFLGLIGFAITVLWFATFRRNSDWYRFRMGQAKQMEEKYVSILEDKDFQLLNKDAEIFADGCKIKGWKNNFSAYAMIVLFAIIYISLIVWSVVHLKVC